MRVSMRKAAELTGRSLHSMRKWSRHLSVDRPGSFPDGWYVDVDDLLAEAQRRMDAYRTREIRPGPGRGHIGEPARAGRPNNRRPRTKDTNGNPN